MISQNCTSNESPHTCPMHEQLQGVMASDVREHFTMGAMCEPQVAQRDRSHEGHLCSSYMFLLKVSFTSCLKSSSQLKKRSSSRAASKRSASPGGVVVFVGYTGATNDGTA